MAMGRAALIHAAMLPVFWMSRVSGVFPLNDQLSVSPPWLALSLALAGVIFASWYIIVSHLAPTFVCMSLVVCPATVLLAGLPLTQRRLYRTVLTDIAHLEERISHIGIEPKYNVKRIQADIGFRTICLLITNLINYRQFDEHLTLYWAETIAFYITQWCISCVEMHIIALASYLSDLFMSLSSGLPYRQVEDVLEEATSLVGITKSFHSLFTREAFLCTSVLFLCGTLDLYHFALTTTLGEGTVGDQSAIIFRSIIRAYELWRVASSLHLLKQQLKRWDADLYTTALEDVTNEIADNEKLLLYFSMKQTVKFSACGFFPIDFTLLHSVVAAVTNYLVILLQFGLSTNQIDFTNRTAVYEQNITAKS